MDKDALISIVFIVILLLAYGALRIIGGLLEIDD
jgi:hypothetical protein